MPATTHITTRFDRPATIDELGDALDKLRDQHGGDATVRVDTYLRNRGVKSVTADPPQQARPTAASPNPTTKS
jgi:hypothetical protein